MDPAKKIFKANRRRKRTSERETERTIIETKKVRTKSELQDRPPINQILRSSKVSKY